MSTQSAALVDGYTTRSTCRVCGSGQLTFLFSLGEQYVSNFIREREPVGIKVPIDLELCRNCSLVQLKHTAPQELLYRRYYWYRSGVTATMRQALRDITQEIEERVPLNPVDVVLDIGSNDGTLLRSYKVPVTKVGVEPANNLVEAGSRGVDHFIHDFWNYETYAARLGGKPARVITAIGMFYDLEDPNQFIADISKALDPEQGVFIAQLMCLRNMLDLGDVGNLAHEHLEFYSLASLHYLYRQHGLEIYDIEENNVNGRSYRIYAAKQGSNVVPPIGAYHRLHKAAIREVGLDRPEVYTDFFENMEENRALTVDFITHEVKQNNKTCWVYGASTKGNVILQYYGLDSSLIEGASDRSKEKWGRYTIGSQILISSEEYARAANPNYFLVLPYAFLDEFIKRESEWRDRGGKFIVPLPEFKVV